MRLPQMLSVQRHAHPVQIYSYTSIPAKSLRQDRFQKRVLVERPTGSCRQSHVQLRLGQASL